MAPWIIPAIMAAMALGKSNNDYKKAAKKADLAAETEKYSPWTGLHGEMPGELADPLMSVGQAALSGYAMSQGIESSGKIDKLTEAQTNYIDRMGRGVSTPGVDAAVAGASSQSMIPGQLGNSSLTALPAQAPNVDYPIMPGSMAPMTSMMKRNPLATNRFYPNQYQGQFMPYSMGY